MSASGRGMVLHIARVVKEETLRPSFRDKHTNVWSFAEVVMLLKYLSDAFTLERVNKSASRLCYSVFMDDTQVLRLEIERNLHSCYVFLIDDKWPQLREVRQEPIARPPPYIYKTRLIHYEISQPDAFQINQVLTTLGHSLSKSLSGVTRAIAAMGISRQFQASHRVSLLDDIIGKLKGIVILKGIETDTTTSDALYTVRQGKLHKVTQFGWMSPSAPDVMKRFSYCELDATFYCLRPYVVCVPQFVYMNTSYPVGIFMGPSENLDLYNLFHECFNRFMEKLPNDQRQPFKFKVLSDGGRAIQGFCLDKNLIRFECHRHLIQGFGTNSVLAAVMLKILRSFDYEEFSENVQVGNKVLEKVKSKGKLSNDCEKKYLRFTGQARDKHGNLVRKTDWASDVAKWALWVRENVTTCSNHAEAFHRVLNALVRPNGRHLGLLASLDLILQAIMNRQEKWQDAFSKNVKNEFSKQEPNPNSVLTECECHYSIRIRQRYELDLPFPCSHLCKERRQQLFAEFLNHGKKKLARMAVTSHVVNEVVFVRDKPPTDLENEANTKPPYPHQLVNDEETHNGLMNLARDIYGILGDRVNREEPLFWIFAWIYEVLQKHNISVERDSSDAYIVAWEYVAEKIKEDPSKTTQ